MIHKSNSSGIRLTPTLTEITKLLFPTPPNECEAVTEQQKSDSSNIFLTHQQLSLTNDYYWFTAAALKPMLIKTSPPPLPIIEQNNFLTRSFFDVTSTSKWRVAWNEWLAIMNEEDLSFLFWIFQGVLDLFGEGVVQKSRDAILNRCYIFRAWIRLL